jgi:hypothetical protein
MDRLLEDPEQKLVDDPRAAFENVKRQQDVIALLTTELQKTKASLQAETQQLAEANSVKAEITEKYNSIIIHSIAISVAFLCLQIVDILPPTCNYTLEVDQGQGIVSSTTYVTLFAFQVYQ